ncbi:MAG: hypothetical protein Pg6C_20660 [Treponemataceae bacterium]|nr:MAG: hypothetical protein Pg6C_20660 [Treponemataceae bacterium]
MSTSLIFSIIGAAVTLGSVFVGIGILKAKLNQAIETNVEQTKKIEGCATRDELALAIKRSDEMLEMMRVRAGEDRAKGDVRHKEIYGVLNAHGERIGKLEISQEQLSKMLDKLEAAVTLGFREMKVDMKELRDVLKQG